MSKKYYQIKLKEIFKKEMEKILERADLQLLEQNRAMLKRKVGRSREGDK